LNKSNKKYFIRQYSQLDYPHGGIGYVDAEKILASEGYEVIQFPGQDDFSLINKFRRFFYLVRVFLKIKTGDELVFLFPVYAKLSNVLLKVLAKRKIRTICFITDINGLKDNDPFLLKQEIRFLRRFEYFIVHNEAMKQWLVQQIPGARAEIIEFFDFLTDPISIERDLSYNIVFAGNLDKSRFLEKLQELHDSSPMLRFHIFGPGHTPAMLNQENAKWEGIILPHQLPAKVEGAFGLVWDGDDINKPGGSLGEYMQYITHHKVSLYIVSGLPVIVASPAGSASLVEKYQVGFAVNNLYEIEEKIKNITPQIHLQMQRNMRSLAERISSGDCLKQALIKLKEISKS
jgi:hypothetical protein